MLEWRAGAGDEGGARDPAFIKSSEAPVASRVTAEVAHDKNKLKVCPRSAL